MKIIEIAALPNGAHRNQTGGFSVLPEGWAVIPDDMNLPASFPFVGLEVVTADESGLPTVVSMTEGVLPERPKEPEHGPTIEERVTTLETSNAELAEALDMILSGVTE